MSWRGRSRRALVVCSLLFWAQAEAGEAPQGARADGASRPLSQVRYVVAVKAPPRTFRNRRADALTLDAAYLSYASFGLGRCAPAPPAAPGTARGAAWLRALFATPVAHAGHEGVLDLAFANDGWVLDLLRDTGARTLAERYFPRTAYCRLQSVAGAAHQSFAGYPSGVRMSGDVLYVRGTVARGGALAPFVLATDLPYGKLIELPASPARDRSVLTVTIAHGLESALEAIDFGRDDVESNSKQLLRALIDGAKPSFQFDRPTANRQGDRE